MLPPQQQSRLGGTANSSALPLPEAKNVLEHPSGPEFQLQLSEGVYTLHDDLILGAIPPHPSEPVVQNVNVLDNRPVAPTAGTRVSLSILAPRRPASHLRRIPTSNSYNSSLPPTISEHPGESQHTTNDHEPSAFSAFRMGAFRARFGDANGSLAPFANKDAKDPAKRRKPKSNMTKSSSSFVSKVIPHETINKRLADHNPEGAFAFVNISRAVHWLDLSAANKAEQLTKILFTKAHALCHDINESTKSSSHLDVVMGFSTADLIWYEPISQKYSRLNKNGLINLSPISEVRWLPGSENLFIAAHYDGTLIVYDKEKEDAPFLPEEHNVQPLRISNDGKKIPRLLVQKSIHSVSDKTNPVAVWKATKQRINGIEFSPDGSTLAIVSEDGTLRIYDYMKEQLIDIYASYYGGLTCVCWSPDGMYILTGGQDDLVSIWSVADRVLVARCVGHHSWVRAVAFDPWRCDERTYRFGSVGEDCRLLLWDFSVGMLHRPRAASMSIRQSISSFVPAGSMVDRSPNVGTANVSSSGVRSIQETTDYDPEEIVHRASPRAQIATLPPILSKEIDEHGLSWIAFQYDSIITACRKGHVRTWDRPPEDETLSSNGGISGEDGKGNFANPFRDP